MTRKAIKLVVITSSMFLFSLAHCKKTKGIDSATWKDESLKITAQLCEKYRECSDRDWKGVPEKLKEFAKARLEESNCQKKFRESNAYKLIGNEPINIMTSYRGCHKNIMTFSCDELKTGKIDQIPECVLFQNIQAGN